MNKIKHKIDQAIEKFLLILETLIAIASMVVLIGLLIVEFGHIFTDLSFFSREDAVSHFLHEILSIVIGLEFVKLLMHLTPANILEVLTMAIARGIIVNHGSALDNLLSIACIIGMFAARRYLIPRNELYQEMDEAHHHTGGGRKHHHGKHHGHHDSHHDNHTEKQETH